MYFWLWIGVMVASVILEALTPSALICIWFAPAALLALILNQLSISFLIQTIIFFATGIALLFIARPIAKEYLRGNIIATNADRVIGKKTKLIKAIKDDNYGEVKINGVIWNAISHNEKPINEATLVEVLAIDGSKLVVKEI